VKAITAMNGNVRQMAIFWEEMIKRIIQAYNPDIMDKQAHIGKEGKGKGDLVARLEQDPEEFREVFKMH
jgi:hypothetical protein